MESISQQQILEFSLAIIGVFTGIYLLTSTSKKQNYFLGLYFLVQFIPWIIEIFISSNYKPELIFVYYPLLYLYSKEISEGISKKDWTIFYFSILLFFVKIGIDYFFPGIQISFIYTILFSIVILSSLKRHNLRMLDYFSNIENKSLIWVKILVYIQLMFISIWIFEDLSIRFLGTDLFIPQVSMLLTFVSIWWICISAIKQKDIYSASEKIAFRKSKDEISKRKKVALSQDEEDFFRELELNMNRKSLYKLTDLSLRSLSIILGVSEKLISKVIKVKTNNNFYNYVNCNPSNQSGLFSVKV